VKNWLMIQEEFEDTKEVIRIRISKKNRQHNGQKKSYKGTNNDLQNTHETKDRVCSPKFQLNQEMSHKNYKTDIYD
jgi:hypothetical protein